MPHTGFYSWEAKVGLKEVYHQPKKYRYPNSLDAQQSWEESTLHILLWSFETFNHYAYHLRWYSNLVPTAQSP